MNAEQANTMGPQINRQYLRRLIKSLDRLFVFNLCQRIHITLYCLLPFMLNGCATAINTTQLNQLHLHAPIKMLVIETPVSISQNRLQAVFAPDIKAQSIASDALISQGEKFAQKYAMTSMQAALDKQAQLGIMTPLTDESDTHDKIYASNFTSVLTQDEADWIRKTTGADALLRFHITDYGLTPTSWRNGYIAFEVTSTLAIAGVIAYSGSTVAKAAAGVYLTQEAIEESAEAYAGFWALDVTSRPVRIDAELINLNPVSIIWKYSDTGLSNVKLSRLTQNVSTLERNAQLNQSTDYAVQNVVSNLAATLKNINTH